jgi:hypothetical protein
MTRFEQASRRYKDIEKIRSFNSKICFDFDKHGISFNGDIVLLDGALHDFVKWLNDGLRQVDPGNDKWTQHEKNYYAKACLEALLNGKRLRSSDGKKVMYIEDNCLCVHKDGEHEERGEYNFAYWEVAE